MSAAPQQVMMPVGGVAPAVGVNNACNCPVQADEVRYPMGNNLMRSCFPQQLPGYQSTYGMYAPQVATFMPPQMPPAPQVVQAPQPVAMEVPSAAQPAPLVQAPIAAPTVAPAPVAAPAPPAAAKAPVAVVTPAGQVMYYDPQGMQLPFGYGQNSMTYPGNDVPYYLSGTGASAVKQSAILPDLSWNGITSTLTEAQRQIANTASSIFGTRPAPPAPVVVAPAAQVVAVPTPFYLQPWFLVLSTLLVLGGIGALVSLTSAKNRQISRTATTTTTTAAPPGYYPNMGMNNQRGSRGSSMRTQKPKSTGYRY